jgi:hypothetical protein
MHIGIEEDGTLELIHSSRELVRTKVRLKVREVVDRVLAMHCHDHEHWVCADFMHHSAPYCFDSHDGIGQGSVMAWLLRLGIQTYIFLTGLLTLLS